MTRRDRPYISDIAFTPAVKALQLRAGSRHAYSIMEQGAGWQTQISTALAGFISAQTSVFLATVNSEGQPYIQHRGGPQGFLHVLDDNTIAFVDFTGNQQYITTGNLSVNCKAHMFLIDYQHQQRVKLWGEMRTVEDDILLLSKLTPNNYPARVERVMLFTITAWDANCSQHIPLRYEAAAVHDAIEHRDLRIKQLESDLVQLRDKKN